MTNRFAAACCVLLAVVITQAQAPPPAPAGTGLIVGQVVDAATGRGVPDVAVTPTFAKDIGSDGSVANQRGVVSDREGRFVFRGLPPGDYMLAARRFGYVQGFYGAPIGSVYGKPIALSEGGRFGNARIEISKFAVIAGRVVDDAGEPIIGIQVRAFKRNLIAGRWKFGEYYSNQKYGARTDDRGMYRISDVEPGEYVVTVPLTTNVAPAAAVAELQSLQTDPSARAAYQAANEAFNIGSFQIAGLPRSVGTANAIRVGDAVQTLMSPSLAPVASREGPWLMYQTQFYPASSAASGAQPIAMKAGEERSGIDFQMRPVRTSRVSGVVTGLPAGQSIALRLEQTDGDLLLDDTLVAATLSAPDGTFTFLGVPSGQYAIKILRIPVLPDVATQIGSVTRLEQAQGASAEPSYWAGLPISVGAGDVSGLTIPLNNGTRARGQLVFEGSSPKPTKAQLASYEVTLELADGQKPLILKSDQIRLASESFETTELTPGKYILRTFERDKWTLKSAMAGGRDISDVPLVVDGRGIPPITVTFTDRPLPSVQGRARDGGGVPGEAFVCVFPVEREMWVDYGNTPRRLRRTQVNQSGAFRLEDLPAGDYFLVAVQGDRIAEWRDPKLLEALSRIATKISLAGEEAKTIDLSVQKSPAASRSPLAREFGYSPMVADERDAASIQSGPFFDDADNQQQAPPRTSRVVPEAVGSGSIAGVLTSDGTNPTPIRRAVVLLNATDPRVARSAVTDDSGRFTFASLPGARYSLSASKPGYLPARYGATIPGRAGTPIVLADGANATANMKLIRGAVITGTIRDPYGEPVRNVSVALSRFEVSGGERRLVSAGRTEQPTDDRGQYRIVELEAGEYFVNVERANIGYYRSLRQTTAQDLAAAQQELSSTAPPAAASVASPEMGYTPVFYPGTARFSEAAPIAVRAGEERAGIDITLRLVALARLKARVIGPDGQPPAMVQAALSPLTPLPGLSTFDLPAGRFFPITDGVVQIYGIQPGEYTLEVGGSSVAPPPMQASGGGGVMAVSSAALGLPMYAFMPVTVDGSDIDDLTIQLQAGKHMTGRAVFEGTTPPPASVPVFLTGPRVSGISLQRRATATPEFSIDGIIPAAYRVGATLRGWTLKSALVNGQDAADRPIEIVGDVSDVVLTFTDKLTELSGVLQTAAGKPAADYFVIVFPRDSAFWINGSRRIVGLRPATDGRFVTSATAPLPPGEYLIAAVTDVANGQWFDPELLNSLVPAAIPLTLGEGEKKRQDLQIK